MLTCLFGAQKIYIDDSIKEIPLRDLGREGKLLCPDPKCRCPVILRQGKFNRPHFAHQKGEGKNCHFGNGESEEHEEGKRHIFNLLRSIYKPEQVMLEETLDSGQKADVLLDLGNQIIAFEIQFSEQDGNTWESRIDKYRGIGVASVWILGYRKPIHEIISYRGDREPAKIKLGRTREYAVQKAQLVQELSDQLFERPQYFHDAWEIIEKYQVVHILTVSEGILEFYLGYVVQKSATIWEGYILPITQSSFFDQRQVRFTPDSEISARQSAESKHQVRIEWRTRILSIQDELRQKVLAYTKVERIEWLPVVLANEEVFYGHVQYGTYDFLLLEVALYLKIIRMRSFYEDTIEELFHNWKFEWKEYRDLFLRGEIGDFFDRLIKAGVLSHDGWNWSVTGELSSEMPYR